jgi:hypothetical protein
MHTEHRHVSTARAAVGAFDRFMLDHPTGDVWFYVRVPRLFEADALELMKLDEVQRVAEDERKREEEHEADRVRLGALQGRVASRAKALGVTLGSDRGGGSPGDRGRSRRVGPAADSKRASRL